MTKQEAKRWVCGRVWRSLSAGLVEDEASESLSAEDLKRVQDATGELIEELKRRAEPTAPRGEQRHHPLTSGG